jgi:hypothetical protein
VEYSKISEISTQVESFEKTISIDEKSYKELSCDGND